MRPSVPSGLGPRAGQPVTLSTLAAASVDELYGESDTQRLDGLVWEHLIVSDTDAAPITREQVAELLLETGHHHHQAYADSDGVDPEWALWYSGYLQSHLWDRAGSLPTRSLLVHLLLSAERDHASSSGDVPWPQFYAAAILAALESA